MNEAVFIGSRSTSANLPWLPVDFATIGELRRASGCYEGGPVGGVAVISSNLFTHTTAFMA